MSSKPGQIMLKKKLPDKKKKLTNQIKHNKGNLRKIYHQRMMIIHKCSLLLNIIIKKQQEHNNKRLLSSNQLYNQNILIQQEFHEEKSKTLHKFQQSCNQNAISYSNKAYSQGQLPFESQYQNSMNDLKMIQSQAKETSDVIPPQRQILRGNAQKQCEENKKAEECGGSQKDSQKSNLRQNLLKFDITNQIMASGYEQLKEGFLFKPVPKKDLLKEKRQRQIQNKSSFDAIFIKKNQKIMQYKNNLEQQLLNQVQYRNSIQPRLNKPSNLLLYQKDLIQNKGENQVEENQSDLNAVISKKNNQNSKCNQKYQQSKNLNQGNKIENIQISKSKNNLTDFYTYQINSSEKINIQILQSPDDTQGPILPHQQPKFDQFIPIQQEKLNVQRNSLQTQSESSFYYQNQKDFCDQSQNQVNYIYSNQPSQNTINSFKMQNASFENNQKNEFINQNNTNMNNSSNKSSTINQNCLEVQSNIYLQNQNASSLSSSLKNKTNTNSMRLINDICSDKMNIQNENNQNQNNKNNNQLNNIILNQTFDQIPSSSEDFENEITLEDSNMKTMIENTNEDPKQIQYEQERRQFKELYDNIKKFGQQGDLLFEEFMIIGPDLEELKDLIHQNPNTFRNQKEFSQGYVKGNIQQSILFSQPCYISPFQDQLRQDITQQAFPQGVQYYRYKSQSDLQNMPGKFKDIFLMNLCKQKQRGVDQNIFILTLMGDDYKRSKHISLQNTNSNSLMYGICYQQYDLLVAQDEVSQEKTIFLFPTVYCIITQYPFIDYFLKIILEIVNRIKTIRLIKGSFSGKIDNNLQDIDFEKVIFYLQRDRELSLSLSALQIKEPSPDRVLTYFLKNVQSYLLEQEDQISSSLINRITHNSQATQYNQFNTLSFNVPILEEMCYVEGLETAYLTFSNLPYSDFQLIFTLIMLEKKVIFLSENITLLTFTIITFQNIINPFKFPYSIISSLSKDRMGQINCPVPFIFGVNLSSDEFKYQYGYDDECYYIDLDKNVFTSLNPIDIDTIYNQRFKFTSQKEQIKQIFKAINNKISSRQLGNKFKKLFQASQNHKQLVYNPDEQQIKNLKTLLVLIRKSIYQCIVNKLQTSHAFLQNDDFEQLVIEVQKAILKNNLKDKAFLESFVQTQTFSFYIQQIYL
ncbi:DENN domain protein (macronuclear) [Tetrahymena thermophila SB210]|uniref:DENN domain protein n=1 Tax=Tetrahymena thermophila (strain SB210) TaxID=312017 RepID=Q229F8_TETTS|nr:DENN domain protein [Tetrahymena thermophila SB210]EAR81926.2 DENN domain protein [Tetrahymena thermophila SB210]|eukprot:XP_001029589.2 DENN domain protein [Tetrahymena thermophila SB210]